MADTTEKELWVRFISFMDWVYSHLDSETELLRLSRTNFSESFQILVHLKIIRLFVESVLRFGLPANYIGIVVKVGNALLLQIMTIRTHVEWPSPNPSQPRRFSTSFKTILPTSAHVLVVRKRRKLEGEEEKSSLENINLWWNRTSMILFCMKYLGSLISLLSVPHPPRTSDVNNTT